MIAAWTVLLVGMLLATGGSTIAVGAAAVGRLELARWVTRRLKGASLAGAVEVTPARILGAANGLATVGMLLSGLGVMAVLTPLPPILAGVVVVCLVVPLAAMVMYAVPRAVGRHWAEEIVRRAGPTMHLIARVFEPLLPSGPGSGTTGMAAVVRAGGADAFERQGELAVVAGVLAFTQRLVRDVMTPRTAIVAVAEDTPLADLGRLLAETGYSRIPVYRGSLDNIVGTIYAFDLLKVAPGGELPVRPVSVVPTSKPCGDVLFEMQRERRQFAVVLDEFGGTAGIATFEDLLEALVTEIFDGNDAAAPGDAAGAGELVEVDGATAARDVAARFGVAFPAGSETIGGLLARAAGRIPRVGERLLLSGLEFDVLQGSSTRVERLAVRRGPVPTVPLDIAGSR
jgi:CBS domain containing-hemolysin-like protein